jgi:hypothetical protein
MAEAVGGSTSSQASVASLGIHGISLCHSRWFRQRFDGIEFHHGSREKVDLHFDELTKGGGWRALEELKRTGEVRAIGCGVNQLGTIPEWVHSTLVETTILVYEMVLSRLTDEERNGFYSESCRFAGLFGLSSTSLPPDWTAFTNYTQAMHQSDTLGVTRHAQMLSDHMFGENSIWPRLPAWYLAVTAQLLPQRLRKQFGFSYGETEQRVAETTAPVPNPNGSAKGADNSPLSLSGPRSTLRGF